MLLFVLRSDVMSCASSSFSLLPNVDRYGACWRQPPELLSTDDISLCARRMKFKRRGLEEGTSGVSSIRCNDIICNFLSFDTDFLCDCPLVCLILGVSRVGRVATRLLAQCSARPATHMHLQPSHALGRTLCTASRKYRTLDR